jgi:20S proteasome alpha/beta subunit
MERKLSFLFLILFFGLRASSQAPQNLNNLQNVVPPSPNASALGRYGEWPISLYTGLPNIDIPIYELKTKAASIPISLSYHASGNRVGDVASWVGLGWSLNAGGMISRVVRGWPDESDVGYFNKRQLYTNQNDLCSFPVNVNSASEHKAKVAKGEWDSEQDLYSFNALGKSFTFFIKADGSIIPCPFSNVKITTNFSPAVTVPENVYWIALFEDGTRLEFGGSGYIEVNTNPRFDLGITYFTTSWLLKTVTSSYGETINFTYTSSVIDQDTYYSENDYVKYKLQTVSSGYGACPEYMSGVSKGTKAERQNVTVLSPATIESQLLRIEFELAPNERLDIKGIGAKALSLIKIYSKLEDKYIQKYQFIYSYSQSIASIEYWNGVPTETDREFYKKRLRLNSLIKAADNLTEEYRWSFAYNSQNLPSRRSFAQDHWGFFNGKITNNSLLPKYTYPLPSNILQNYSNAGFNPPSMEAGVSREGDGNYSNAEILESVTYPTGGKTSFYFEANAIAAYEEQFTQGTSSVNLNLSSTSNPYTPNQQQTFSLTIFQNCAIGLNSYISPAIFNDMPNAWVRLEIINSSTQALIGGLTAMGISEYNSTTRLNISPGTYLIKISTNVSQSDFGTTDAIIASGYIQYEQSLGMQNINKNTGGLRLQKMVNYDGIDPSRNIEKYYSYENPLIINPVNIQKQYFTESEERTCDEQAGTVCDNKIITRNSSTKYSLGNIQGGTVGYGKVTTQYGLNGVNGKTITEFSNEEDYGTIEAQDFPYPPTDSKGHRRGLVLKETQYTASGIRLSEQINTYEFAYKTAIASFKAGYLKTLPSNQGTGCGAYGCTNVYGDCEIQKACYNTTSEQVKFLTSTLITYDQAGSNPLTTLTSNFYDNPNNLQPVRIETTSSEGEIIKTINRTALEKTDINTVTPLTTTASAAIDAMLVKNIISPVIQQEQYKNNVLQSRSLTNFKNWDATIIQPENVQLQTKNNPIETRFQFINYDASGNLLEQKKSNDVVHSYIWGYSNAYPVAEVVNAKSNEIFFDGFEENTPGWEWSLTAYDNSFKRTGSKSGRIDKPTSGEQVCLSNKWLNISLTAMKKFKFSGWVYSNGPSVELFLIMKRAGETGYYSYFDRVETNTTGKWVYIEKVADVPADVTQMAVRVDNNGGGTVWYDDIRLHPADAHMTTYTYAPLIGMTSQTDINNRTAYYEYDNFNRLVLVRDHDNNIVKKICYNYAGQAENCVVTTYYNVAKSGNFTRNNCAAGGTPNTVTYTVAANTYSSATSQAAADQLAQDDVNNNGQTYANNNGTCTFYNVQKSGNFTRNNCPAGGTPSTVTYNVAAGTYNSTTSQAVADQLAQNDVNANGQTYANNNGTCTFYNVQKSGNFTRNNCPSGYAGSTVTYTVLANTYSSTTSQAAADQLAQDDVNANGQAYANTNGTCTPVQVTLTSLNNAAASGFTAVFTNVSTSQQYTFNINLGSNPLTMGTIPPGTYNISISKSGNTIRYVFGVYNNSCSLTTASGRSATFFNIVVSVSSSCNGVQIDNLN